MKNIIAIIILISFTINGQTWKSYNSDNSGLPDNNVKSIAISHDGTVWFATANGLASFKDNNWKVFTTTDGLSINILNMVSFIPSFSSTLWIASFAGANILDFDSNNDITGIKYISKANDNIVSDTVTAIDVDGYSSNWIGTDKGLSVITNSGVYNFTEDNGFENPKVNTLKSLSDNWVHVGTDGDGVNRLKYNGVDGISSASKIITTWSGIASDTILTVYVTDDTLKWYGTPQGVSTFHGENTKDINNWWRYNTFTSEIIDNYVRSIIRDNSGNMWFGTRKGLSKLSADKLSWESFTEENGLISNNIFDIKVDNNNNLWIATDKGVSYISDLTSDVGIIQPNEYKLKLENYPNPFNPVTTIEYSIPAIKEGQTMSLQTVRLVIYDILGNRVATLINKQQYSGTYKVIWEATEYSSGIYYYRLTSGQLCMTRKMLLLK